MATATITYKCDHCAFTSKTKSGTAKHEAMCKHNTTRVSLVDAEVETIRQTATSVPHLLELLDAFWVSHGLKVKFKQYPSVWYDTVSNSHNSPAGYPTNWGRHNNPELPKGYPGWRGSWEGTVSKLPNYKGNNKEPGAGEAFGGSFTKDNIRIPFINIGGGSGGNRFNYDGILFLYDFPLMHKQWKSEKGEYKLLGEQYNANIKQLTNVFTQTRSMYVAKQDDINSLRDLEVQLGSLRRTLSTTTEAAIAYHSNEYSKANPIDIPEIPSAFIDNKAYENLVNLNLFVESALPDTAALFTRTSELAATITEYSTKYPEYFI